jgi:hypothetical protein
VKAEPIAGPMILGSANAVIGIRLRRCEVSIDVTPSNQLRVAWWITCRN